jgi:TonB-linked SusC/RagA family outer membrane protein
MGVLLLLLGQNLDAQVTPLSGKIITKNGQPLTGATVLIKGSGRGAETDSLGAFSIAANPADVFIISSVGFQSKEVLAKDLATNAPIVLELADQQLGEVVVTALGISKAKKSLGYAVQEVKNLGEAKEANLVSALEGKVAGVRITNSQGSMGSSRIVIRGETSISGNNQPLFVVDGIPVDNSQLGVGGSRDFANAIADLNADDIESVSVLKGPNAAALYGSRAAAGVVLIKTKTGRGKKGLGISVNSGVAIENLLVLPDYQNVYGQGSGGRFSYVDGKGGGINDGVDESWGPKMEGQLIPQFYSNGEAVPFVAHPNNVRDFFRTGTLVTNGISVADAGEKYDYRLSFNNLQQQGVIPNSGQGKNTVSLHSALKLTPALTFTTDVSYFRLAADNLPGAGGRRATSTMLQFTWFGRQVDIDRLRNYRDAAGNTFNWNNSYYSNPYFIAYENTVQQRRNRVLGSAGFNLKLAEGLQLNFRSGNDYYNDRRKLKVAYGTNGTPYGSYEEDGFTVNENNTEATLNFTRSVHPDITVDLLAGGNLRSRFYEENIQIAPRLAVAGVYTLANSRDPLQSSNYYSKVKTNSVFASGQIGYRNYAFLNLTARNDWSSTLPAQNLSYFYPSVNASVVLTEALQLSGQVVNFAKLRGGWSKVGKDADPYQLINTYVFSAPFGSNPQLTASGIDLNENLKPETTTSSELGAEVGFFKNRARLDVSVYNTNSYDQILSMDVSPTTGFRQKLLNAGRINNKGVEVQLSASPVRKAVEWNVDLNYAANRSRVLELDKEGRLQNYVLGSTGSVQVIASVGQPYGTLFGNAFLRDASGNIIVNADGAPRVDPSKKVLGKYTPDWLGGVTNSFGYKGITLSVLVDGSFGGSLYSGTYATGTYTGVLASTLPGRDAEHGGLSYYYPGNDKKNGTVALAGGGSAPGGETVYNDGIIFEGVTADGKENTKILPAQQYYKSFRTIDEANVFDASFVKLREVKLAYALPAAWIRPLRLQGATVSLTGRNLAILYKKVPNIDPETAFNTGNAQGLESLTLPSTRNYGFNINLKF